MICWIRFLKLARWEKLWLCGIIGVDGPMTKSGTGQDQWLDQWAERFHHSGLSVVVLPLLEIGRGLGVLASQVLLLTQPVLAGLVDEASIKRCVTLLEDPAALEGLIRRIERKAEGGG